MGLFSSWLSRKYIIPRDPCLSIYGTQATWQFGNRKKPLFSMARNCCMPLAIAWRCCSSPHVIEKSRNSPCNKLRFVVVETNHRLVRELKEFSKQRIDMNLWLSTLQGLVTLRVQRLVDRGSLLEIWTFFKSFEEIDEQAGVSKGFFHKLPQDTVDDCPKSGAQPAKGYFFSTLG